MTRQHHLPSCFVRRLLTVLVILPTMTVTPNLQPMVGPLTIVATQPHTVGPADAIVDHMIMRGELQVISRVTDPLVSGRSHERLAQFQDGLRIFGAEVTRQREHGQIASIFGTIHSEINIDVVPKMTTQDAIGASRVSDGLIMATELLILHDQNVQNYRLVYRIQQFSPAGLIVSLVDGHTGEVIRVQNDLKTQAMSLPCNDCAVGTGRGVKGDQKKISVQTLGGNFRAYDALRPPAIVTYDMRGNWRGTLDVLTGAASLAESNVATDADNDWHDGASVDAHVGAGWFYDYLAHRFERSGLDGSDGPIISLVHPVDRNDLFQVPNGVRNLFHLNAFFCAACGPHGLMVYGEGLPTGFVLQNTGQSVDFFSGGLDIVAHELGHAVTEFTSQLVYEGESGALNEAFSDLLGVGTEFFMSETGRHKPEQPDYLIGEDVLKPGGIRSIADPQSKGDPDHYSQRFLGNLDNGGVHTNSLIASHAFYLAVEGGINRTSGIQVNGVGSSNRPQVEQAFYRAFAFLLPANATFTMARAATTQSARDLTGGVSDLAETIATAWSAVGVE